MSCTSQKARRREAYQIRLEAACLARDRHHPTHETSRDEKRYRYDGGTRSYIASFTKGLFHNPHTGLVKNPTHYEQFIRAVHSPTQRRIASLPLGPGEHGFVSDVARDARVRGWESMGAGSTFDLQGPDAWAVTMPAVPKMESEELYLEMAEVFWMALLRDVSLSWFSEQGRAVIDNGRNRMHAYRPGLGDVREIIGSAIRGMNRMPWVREEGRCLTFEEARRKGRRRRFSLQNVFRGVTPGDDVGPYLSQFIIIGTPGLGNVNRVTDGIIQYGAMRMNQRVRVAQPAKDYMTDWASFLDVQNGADLRGTDKYATDAPLFRFITTGRDLATYVHHDALYQAYLNACLIMMNMGVPFDRGLPFVHDDELDKQTGFAQFGGPHILTLLTEVATRALKAVRYQKFNSHRRLRPEAVAGILDRYIGGVREGGIGAIGRGLYQGLGKELVQLVTEENRLQNEGKDLGFEDRDDYALLPMAFPEGSPMHPSYGSGHATVGGACVTILKAFFDTDYRLPRCYVVNEDGSGLVEVEGRRWPRLRVEGELNKLCSNISVGRNWAGVHYFSDYYESILLGEKVALGILEEQSLMYGERFSMTVPLFDGTRKRIVVDNC